MRAGLVAMATAVVSLVTAAAALGAVGDLASQGCIADVDDVAGCGVTAQGLAFASDVAVSPDGASVYAVSGQDNESDDAIVRFDRAAGGALTPAGCIADVDDLAGCGATAQGLDDASGVAVSPDGVSVYAVSETDNAIVRFDRAAGGALSNPSCVEDVDDVMIGCGATAQGLTEATDVAVSPDGGSVYAVSPTDNAIVRFDRAASGALSNPSCIEDPEANGSCDDVGAAGEAKGLDSASGVAVSPDGASVYVVGSAIVRFDRAVNGALSNPSCIDGVDDLEGCGATAQSFEDGLGVAVSPDGASVYTVSSGRDMIARFDRAPGGALTPAGCIADIDDLPGCGVFVQGLNGAFDVAVSPDGASVYVSSITDDAIVRFDRATNGALSNSSCFEDLPLSAGCGSAAQGLNGGLGVAVSPDGASVYAVGAGDRAIVRFDRELAPPPSPGPPAPEPQPQPADTNAPSVTIASGPKDKTKKASATFTFNGADPTRAVASFQCSLDGAAFAPCTSPITVKVKPGKHTFQVRAVDDSGNIGPPDSDDWKRKKKKRN